MKFARTATHSSRYDSYHSTKSGPAQKKGVGKVPKRLWTTNASRIGSAGNPNKERKQHRQGKPAANGSHHYNKQAFPKHPVQEANHPVLSDRRGRQSVERARRYFVVLYHRIPLHFAGMNATNRTRCAASAFIILFVNGQVCWIETEPSHPFGAAFLGLFGYTRRRTIRIA